MHPDDSRFQDALESAEMKIGPDPAHVQTVQDRMMAMARNGARHGGRTKSGWIVGLLFFGVCGVGLAATETGRNLIRSIFTPVRQQHQVTVTTEDGSTWIRGGGAGPYSAEEQQLAADQFQEVADLKQAGFGELTGLLEGPEHTVYLVKYTLKSGTPVTVGDAGVSEKQAVNMQIDEIRELRDAGAGQVIVQSPGPIGLGAYTIRFTLSDRVVDLQTWYPPGTREGREAIFAETRRMKEELRFSVVEAGASVEEPEAGVMGTLRYTLSDGRTVGIVEQIPAEAITPDGAYVAVPDTGETTEVQRDGTWLAPDGGVYTISGVDQDEQESVVDEFKQIYAIKQAGGGRLVGLLEGPGWDGQPRTIFQVEYTLQSGETMTVGEGDLSDEQAANMQMGEIQQLRDTGEGEIVARRDSPLGLGRFTIRFTLSDGQTVDLTTWYPPSTRQEREAIFAETRKLKAQRRFTVDDVRVDAGWVWGRLSYTLSDGRSVTHYEQVPTDVISSDGTRIVIPEIGESTKIERGPDR